VPVPANSGAQAGKPAPDLNSNPGIRRPRWGGVDEGVVGIHHPLSYTGAMELTGIGVTDAHLSGYQRAAPFR
jgi:hypothetical protein